MRKSEVILFLLLIISTNVYSEKPPTRLSHVHPGERVSNCALLRAISTIFLKNVRAGVETEGIGDRILKRFGVLRPVDLESF